MQRLIALAGERHAAASALPRMAMIQAADRQLHGAFPWVTTGTMRGSHHPRGGKLKKRQTGSTFLLGWAWEVLMASLLAPLLGGLRHPQIHVLGLSTPRESHILVSASGLHIHRLSNQGNARTHGGPRDIDRLINGKINCH